MTKRTKPANPPQYLQMEFDDYEYKHLPCWGVKGTGKEQEKILVKTAEELTAAKADGFEFPEDQTEA